MTYGLSMPTAKRCSLIAGPLPCAAAGIQGGSRSAMAHTGRYSPTRRVHGGASEKARFTPFASVTSGSRVAYCEGTFGPGPTWARGWPGRSRANPQGASGRSVIATAPARPCLRCQPVHQCSKCLRYSQDSPNFRPIGRRSEQQASRPAAGPRFSDFPSDSPLLPRRSKYRRGGPMASRAFIVWERLSI